MGEFLEGERDRLQAHFAWVVEGVDCNGGTAIAAGNCIDPKAAYDACMASP